MAKGKCSLCGKSFPCKRAAHQHMMAVHKKKRGEVLIVVPPEREESLADLFVQAEIDRLMGLPVEDWIEDSLS